VKRLAILLLVVAGCVWAQTTGTATLVGTVTDQSGARVAGAQVTVVNTATGFTSNTVTTPEGDYYVPYLIPGPYMLTVEATGFKKFSGTSTGRVKLAKARNRVVIGFLSAAERR